MTPHLADATRASRITRFLPHCLTRAEAAYPLARPDQHAVVARSLASLEADAEVQREARAERLQFTRRLPCGMIVDNEEMAA